MKIILLTITTLFLLASKALAHEGETEITNIAESDWTSPLFAVAIIITAMIIARKISVRSNTRKSQQN